MSLTPQPLCDEYIDPINPNIKYPKICYTGSAGKMRSFFKNFALTGGHMYKFERYRQLGPTDFNQPAGLKDEQ